MRSASVTLAALFGVAVVQGQPPAQPAPVAAPEAKVQACLEGWEKATAGLTNFRFALTLKRTNPTFPDTPKTYSGSVLCMKPSFARMRLGYDADKTGNEYEAFICNGKAVYEYNGLAKTVTEWKLPDPKANPAGATDNLMLDLLSGLKAKTAAERFDITFKEEKGDHIYLDVKPKSAKDKAEFQQPRWRRGPKIDHAYLPAGVYFVKPSGDTEHWLFTDSQVNIPGIDEKAFQFEKVAGFQFQQGKPASATLPITPPR